MRVAEPGGCLGAAEATAPLLNCCISFGRARVGGGVLDAAVGLWDLRLAGARSSLDFPDPMGVLNRPRMKCVPKALGSVLE